MRHEDRAKQFMAFAALKGYEELIEEQSEQPPKPTPPFKQRSHPNRKPAQSGQTRSQNHTSPDPP